MAVKKKTDSQRSVEFRIPCEGRDAKQEPVLEEAVHATVTVYNRPGTPDISSMVDCQYISGGHGNRCNATGGKRGVCPYAFDIPHATDELVVQDGSAEWQHRTPRGPSAADYSGRRGSSE